MTSIQLWLLGVGVLVFSANAWLALQIYRDMNGRRDLGDWLKLALTATFGCLFVLGIVISESVRRVVIEPLERRRNQKLAEQLATLDRRLADFGYRSVSGGTASAQLRTMLQEKFALEKALGMHFVRATPSRRCVHTADGAQFLVRVDIQGGHRWQGETELARELEVAPAPDVSDAVKAIVRMPKSERWRAREGLTQDERDQLRVVEQEEKLKSGEPPSDAGAFRVRTQTKEERNEWTALFTGEFRKAIKRIDRTMQGRVLSAVLDIAGDPTRQHGDTIKRLSGDLEGFWRYRLGDYRLLYLPEPSHRRILFIDIDSRSEIYH